MILIQTSVKQDLNHSSRTLGSSHTEHSPPLTINTISVAAPEQEDVHYVKMTHAETYMISETKDYNIVILMTPIHVI